eukprot:2731982-Prymnesium_polylepis.1
MPPSSPEYSSPSSVSRKPGPSRIVTWRRSPDRAASVTGGARTLASLSRARPSAGMLGSRRLVRRHPVPSPCCGAAAHRGLGGPQVHDVPLEVAVQAAVGDQLHLPSARGRLHPRAQQLGGVGEDERAVLGEARLLRLPKCCGGREGRGASGGVHATRSHRGDAARQRREEADAIAQPRGARRTFSNASLVTTPAADSGVASGNGSGCTPETARQLSVLPAPIFAPSRIVIRSSAVGTRGRGRRVREMGDAAVQRCIRTAQRGVRGWSRWPCAPLGRAAAPPLSPL